MEVKEVIEVKEVKDDSLAADFKTSENKSEDKCNVSNFERSDNFDNSDNFFTPQIIKRLINGV